MYIILCGRMFSDTQEGVASKSFPEGKPPDPQFPLTPYPCFISYSLPTTLTPTCTLAFSKFSPLPPPKIGKFPPLMKSCIKILHF